MQVVMSANAETGFAGGTVITRIRRNNNNNNNNDRGWDPWGTTSGGGVDQAPVVDRRVSAQFKLLACSRYGANDGRSSRKTRMLLGGSVRGALKNDEKAGSGRSSSPIGAHRRRRHMTYVRGDLWASGE